MNDEVLSKEEIALARALFAVMLYPALEGDHRVDRSYAVADEFVERLRKDLTAAEV